MTLHPALRRLRRGGLVAAGTVLALTSLAACGGDDSADDAGSSASPSASSSASGDAPESPAESDAAAPVAGEEIDPEDFIAVYQAAVDQATTAKVTMDQTASGLKGSGVLDFESDPVAMQMTATIASMGDIEMRLVDNVMYMKLPMLGDKFISFDLDDPNNPLGSSFAEFIDPGAMLSAFSDGMESASFVGEEDVDGESMDHYTVVSDPSAMLADLELPEGAPAIDLPKTQTIDVWFDQDGFFRQVVTDLGELGKTSLTYDDWGTDVSIEKPPSDEVTTMPGAPAA
jgi:hypothetical protein